MELLINTVKLVLGELHFGFSVAIDTPTHAQV
jgi:hypothetical protein